MIRSPIKLLCPNLDKPEKSLEFQVFKVPKVEEFFSTLGTLNFSSLQTFAK